MSSNDMQAKRVEKNDFGCSFFICSLRNFNISHSRTAETLWVYALMHDDENDDDDDDNVGREGIDGESKSTLRIVLKVENIH